MKLFYHKLGHGKPVIILHGLYGSSDNWYTIGKKLADKYQVYLLDQRNHGNSPHSVIHNYEVMAKDLKEFFDSIDISKAFIIGHSMGGKTAISFAHKYPAKVDKIIAIDISPFSYLNDVNNNTNYKLHKKILNGLMRINLNEIHSREEADTKLKNYIESKKLRQFLLKNLKRIEKSQFYWRINLNTLFNELDKILYSVEYSDISTEFEILFIKGEYSDHISNDDISSIMQLYKNVTIKEIKKAGHWIHSEQPDELLDTILQFIER